MDRRDLLDDATRQLVRAVRAATDRLDRHASEVLAGAHSPDAVVGLLEGVRADLRVALRVHANLEGGQRLHAEGCALLEPCWYAVRCPACAAALPVPDSGLGCTVWDLGEVATNKAAYCAACDLSVPLGGAA